MTTWYDTARTHKSLGSTSARPGSLAGLHEARKRTLSQFFTPSEVAALLWRIVTPAMDAAIARRPGSRVALVDTSVGSGRLFQFADPDKHSLAGADIHGPSIDALTEATEAAGFQVDLVTAGLETLRLKCYGVALLNPPFSITLDSPTVLPLPGNSFGRFGPASSATSHRYAVEQALLGADVVLAILPRSTASVWIDDTDTHDRLRAVLTLPPRSFSEEGTDVAVDLVVFGHQRKSVLPVLMTLSTLDDALPDFDLHCANTYEMVPRPLNPATISSASASITLPVTGSKRVRVVHQGRWIHSNECGLTQAKVENALLRRPVNAPSDTHRYPKGVRFAGQGQFDLELYLLQSDPLAAFEATLSTIRANGGEPDVDAGLANFLRKRIRTHERESTPFRHVIPSVGGASADASDLRAKSRRPRLMNPNKWGSGLLTAGESYPVVSNAGEYVITHPVTSETLTLSEPEFLAAFELEGVAAADDGWVVAHEGRVAKYPQLAQNIRSCIERMGIDRWLDRDYQVHDICEVRMGRGATVSWAMALGKTRCAIALALLGGKHSLIVLEPHLIEEFTDEMAKIGLADDLWQVIRRPDDCRSLQRINIVSYNRLRIPIAKGAGRRTYASLLRRRIGTLVADEADILANHQSQQSQAIAMISPRRRILMSGTPVRNMPRDLLGVTSYVGGDGTALQPFGRHNPYAAPFLLAGMDHACTGAKQFTEQHSVLEWVTHEFIHSGLISGAKRETPKVRNIPALRAFAAPLLKRRILEEPEVARYIQVPKPNKFVTTLEWDAPHLAHYLTVADEFANWYRQARKQADGNGSGMNLIALLARIGVVVRAATCPQFETPGFGVYAPLTSKQRYLIDRMETLAAEGRKTICFVEQPHMADLLTTQLRKRDVEAVPFHGGIPIAARVADMNRRFRKGSAPVMVATTATLQSGYNLPQANYVLFGNRCWVSRTESQSLHRVLRGEQQNDVDAEFVHLRGSIDVYQDQVVSMKRDSIDAVVDCLAPQLQETEFLHMDAILDGFVLALAQRQGFETGYELREHLKHAA